MKAEIRDSAALGRILQQARLRKGLTQKQLADKLGMRQADIWQMESGQTTKYAERLFELLRATGTRLNAELETEQLAKPKTSNDRENS